MPIRTPGRHRRPGRLSTASHLTRSAAIAAASTGLVVGSAVTSASAAPVPSEPTVLSQDGALAADPDTGTVAEAIQGLIESGLLTDRQPTLDTPAEAVAAPADVDPADFGIGGFTAAVVEPVEEPAAEQEPAAETQQQAQAAVESRPETSASRSEQRSQPAAQTQTQTQTQTQAQAPQDSQPAAPQVPQGNGGAASIASGLMGIPYAWGGSSPSTGMDCSGFTRYVYAQLGITLPHNSAAQQAMATPVSNPVPGDLVFFGYPAWHVGIYAGNGMIYHATSPGSVSNYMSISSMYGSVSGYGRIG